VKPHLTPLQGGKRVSLEPVSVEDREALLALFRAVERVDKQWKGRRSTTRRVLRFLSSYE
jgi:hypothetical protein